MKQKKLFKELQNALDQEWFNGGKPIGVLSLAQMNSVEKEMDGKIKVKIAIQMRNRPVIETQEKVRRQMVQIVAL